MATCLFLLASHPAAALDQVSMQLKWKHQFQFAGYYAALEQGFYRDVGLDVSIREGGPDIDVTDTVAAGKADFGVCSANVLRDWRVGRRLAYPGDPPALPGRQHKFDIYGGRPSPKTSDREPPRTRKEA